MDNVINLFEKDLESCGYFEAHDREIGVAIRDGSLKVLPLNLNEIELILGDESKVYTRKELAEFLKVAGVLIDSQDKYLPQLELVGLNYA